MIKASSSMTSKFGENVKGFADSAAKGAVGSVAAMGSIASTVNLKNLKDMKAMGRLADMTGLAGAMGGVFATGGSQRCPAELEITFLPLSFTPVLALFSDSLWPTQRKGWMQPLCLLS